jgi:hypothetical protein
MSARKKDHGTAIVIGIIVLGIGAAIFGIALEVLKFAALVKWVFT